MLMLFLIKRSHSSSASQKLFSCFVVSFGVGYKAAMNISLKVSFESLNQTAKMSRTVFLALFNTVTVTMYEV